MTFLFAAIRWELLVFLSALFVLILLQILTGRINTRGLLYGAKGDGSSYLSPERVQLLLMTVGAAFQYLTAVIAQPNAFPPIQESWIALLGGSHVVYLGGKFGASLIGRRRS